MIVIEESKCSGEFKAAFAALDDGAAIRRSSWATGTFLRKNGDRINVYRNNEFSAPDWIPSSTELKATNWVLT